MHLDGINLNKLQAISQIHGPTRTRKPGRTGEHFPVREKSGNFVQTGKVREFYPKYWKSLKKLYITVQWYKSNGL